MNLATAMRLCMQARQGSLRFQLASGKLSSSPVLLYGSCYTPSIAGCLALVDLLLHWLQTRRTSLSAIARCPRSCCSLNLGSRSAILLLPNQHHVTCSALLFEPTCVTLLAQRFISCQLALPLLPAAHVVRRTRCPCQLVLFATLGSKYIYARCNSTIALSIEVNPSQVLYSWSK